MSETEDAESEVIEAMSRAMCVADGYDPDRDIGAYPSSGELNQRSELYRDDGDKIWNLYEADARRQYAAHLAMLHAMEKQGD